MLSPESLSIMHLSLLIISGLSSVARCHPNPYGEPDADPGPGVDPAFTEMLLGKRQSADPSQSFARSRSFASAGSQPGSNPFSDPFRGQFRGSQFVPPSFQSPPATNGQFTPPAPEPSNNPAPPVGTNQPSTQSQNPNLLDGWLKNNSDWASKQKPEDLARWDQGQSPTVMYIGCSDSRIPPDTILGLPIGSVFCHRNVGNIFHLYDNNLLAVLEYAILELKIEHVIVAGHYKCGGVHAVLNGISVTGLYVLDGWLAQMEALMVRNKAALNILTEERKWERLAELNADESAQLLAQSKIVRDATSKGQRVNVHSMFYDIRSGKLNLIQTYSRP